MNYDKGQLEYLAECARLTAINRGKIKNWGKKIAQCLNKNENSNIYYFPQMPTPIMARPTKNRLFA
ncbi:MAG: hypothetical protein LBU68_02860 [Rickettsiales bacterium]|jgi:hypothetical protein|nr:hypothetical protein [Rickettsiales bacterium]